MCQQIFLNFVREWRLWIRPVVMTVYALIIIVLLPILVTKAASKGFRKEDQGFLIGGVFVLMALPIAFWEIIQHMVHYTKPKLQKHIIRILWMVPVYALNAWLGMAIPSHAIYLDSLRECYEAYVIYNFMKFLLNYLSYEEVNFVSNLELKPQTKHIFPLCWLPNWEMGRELIHNCKHGILQYAVVRPLTSAISFVCELAGVYKEGEFQGDAAYPYMLALNNFSQFVAMYCLVIFYKANKEELTPMKPIGKFICIKAVVFFSFFQGVIITILVNIGVISSVFDTSDTADIKGISSRLQNFLICIEMFMAAVAHHYSFSYKPYVNDAADRSCCAAFLAMWDVSDVHSDVKEHLGVVGSTLSRHIRGRGMYLYPNEGSYLLRTPDTNIQPTRNQNTRITFGRAFGSAPSYQSVSIRDSSQAFGQAADAHTSLPSGKEFNYSSMSSPGERTEEDSSSSSDLSCIDSSNSSFDENNKKFCSRKRTFRLYLREDERSGRSSTDDLKTTNHLSEEKSSILS